MNKDTMNKDLQDLKMLKLGVESAITSYRTKEIPIEEANKLIEDFNAKVDELEKTYNIKIDTARFNLLKENPLEQPITKVVNLNDTPKEEKVEVKPITEVLNEVTEKEKEVDEGVKEILSVFDNPTEEEVVEEKEPEVVSLDEIPAITSNPASNFENQGVGVAPNEEKTVVNMEAFKEAINIGKDAAEQLAVAEKKIKILEARLNENASKDWDSEHEIETRSKELLDKISDLNKKLSEKQSELDKTKNKLSELEKQITQKDSELANVKKSLNESLNSSKPLQDELETLKAELEKLKSTPIVDDINTIKSKYKKTMKALYAACEDIEAEHEDKTVGEWVSHYVEKFKDLEEGN